MYMVRFVRRDGKPDEEYYYQSFEEAENHFHLFDNDNSGLYKMICIELFHQELCECIATIVF